MQALGFVQVGRRVCSNSHRLHAGTRAALGGTSTTSGTFDSTLELSTCGARVALFAPRAGFVSPHTSTTLTSERPFIASGAGSTSVRDKGMALGDVWKNKMLAKTAQATRLETTLTALDKMKAAVEIMLLRATVMMRRKGANLARLNCFWATTFGPPSTAVGACMRCLPFRRAEVSQSDCTFLLIFSMQGFVRNLCLDANATPFTSTEFSKEMHSLGLNDVAIRGIQRFTSKHFQLCTTCAQPCPCTHNPATVEAAQSLFVRVPVLKRGGVVQRWGYFFPLQMIYAELLNEPDVLASLIDRPSPQCDFSRGRLFLRISTECRLRREYPLCVDLFTDAAQMVRLGQFSLWACYMRIANSVLTHASTTRFVGLIPILKAADYSGMSAAKLRKLRLGVYQTFMAAVCASGSLYLDQPLFTFPHALGGSVYRPTLAILSCDSKDHAKGAGINEKVCFRCNGSDTMELFAPRYATMLDQANSSDLRLVGNFTVGLSLADLALNGGVCILHVGDTTWTKKLLKWTGTFLALISPAPGPGRPPKDAPLTVLQQVA